MTSEAKHLTLAFVDAQMYGSRIKGSIRRVVSFSLRGVLILATRTAAIRTVTLMDARRLQYSAFSWFASSKSFSNASIRRILSEVGTITAINSFATVSSKSCQ